MPDNRRRHANTVPIAKFIAFLAGGAFLCVAGLGYMWCKNQIVVTGAEIKKCETELSRLKSSNENVRTSIAMLTATDKLQKSFSVNRSKLVPIGADHLVVMGPALRSAPQRELRPVANERKQE